MASIATLPDKVLREVFNLVDTEEHKNLANVCHRWRVLMDESVGTVLVVGVRGTYTTQNTPLDYLAVMSAFGLSLFSPSPSVNLERAESPMQKNNSSKVNKKTNKVSLVGSIGWQTLKQILESPKNLTAIHFHCSVLGYLKRIPPIEEKDLPQTFKLDLPRLKCIVLDDTGLYRNMVDDFEFDCIYDAASCLLNQNQFPSIERLIVQLPLYEKKEAELTCAMANFLENHSKTIKSFVLHQNFLVDAGETSSDNSEMISSVNKEMIELCAKKIRNVNLEELYICLLWLQESALLWNIFVLHQTAMKELIVIKNDIEFPQHMIQQNIQTLTTLVLKTGSNIDAVHFSGSCLKTLIIVGKEAEKYRKYSVCIMPVLNNCLHLPASLEILKLHTVSVSITDVNIFSLESSVKDLALESIGTTQNFGLSAATFGQILDKKTIQHFRFKSSFNVLSFLDNENIPKNMELIYLMDRKELNTTAFEGYLNPKYDRYTNEYDYSTADNLNNSGKAVRSGHIFNLPALPERVEDLESNDYSESSEEDETDSDRTVSSSEEYDTYESEEESASEGDETGDTKVVPHHADMDSSDDDGDEEDNEDVAGADEAGDS